MEILDRIKGFIPTVVVDRRNGRVLMVAYSTRESLEKTIRTGYAHFWSRKRKKIWMKGEESGNKQRISDIYVDCDFDTLIFRVEEEGDKVACHTGMETCFFRKIDETGRIVESDVAPSGIIDELEKVIISRKREGDKKSYTVSLLKGGIDKILEKVNEESSELLSASKDFYEGKDTKEHFIWEFSDLLYHILVLSVFLDIPLNDIYEELLRRRK